MTVALTHANRSPVRCFRSLARRYAGWAALLFAAALVLRIAVPAGFMPSVSNGTITVGICNGSPGGPGTMAIAIPGLDGESEKLDKAQQGCAFADLAEAMTPGADPIQLAAALAFILALGLARSLTLPPHAPARLRPPLRGPPISA